MWWWCRPILSLQFVLVLVLIGTLHFVTVSSLLVTRKNHHVVPCRLQQKHILAPLSVKFPRLAQFKTCLQEAQSKNIGYKNLGGGRDDYDDHDHRDQTLQEFLRDNQIIETPHAGRHFLPSHPAYQKPRWRRWWYWTQRRKRFMEGWYYRLTLVEHKVSFAFILSIEDAGLSPPSPLRLACIQVVGPEDGYLVQADRDDTKFWAYPGQQALGCNFEYLHPTGPTESEKVVVTTTTTAMTPNQWKQTVKSGFQILPRRLLGRVDGHDGSQGGVLKGQGVPGYCEFDIQLYPICGYGGLLLDSGARSSSHNSDKSITVPTTKQKSTGGWLSNFKVFEPHWQVTMADARASGTVLWNNTTYTFDHQPFYAEKNWGAALPSKWYWTQCNSFEGYDHQLSVTAGGGIRKVPFGQQEALGMVSVHYNGTLYEAVPWTGSMSWNVSTWGFWKLQGTCMTGPNPFEVEVVYHCNPQTTPGLVFRAPTPDQGMVYFCRDTFDADTTLTLWELEMDSSTKTFVRKAGPPLIDQAKSAQGGAEIGGGPWWDSWIATSRLKTTIRTLLSIPYQMRSLRDKIQNKVYLSRRKR
jgi:tocopherol cyclase